MSCSGFTSPTMLDFDRVEKPAIKVACPTGNS